MEHLLLHSLIIISKTKLTVMIKVFLAISRWLASYTSFFIIGIAIFTFFLPHTFDWVRGDTQTVILGVIMLTMGLTLTTEDFRIWHAVL